MKQLAQNTQQDTVFILNEIVLAWFLGLLLFGIYLTTYDGTMHSTDGLSVFAVTESIVKHGRFDTIQLENWEDSPLGLDDLPYSVFPIGPTLVVIPVYLMGFNLPRIGISQISLILMPLMVAAAAPFIYLVVRRLKYPIKTALVTTILSVLATMAWPYTYDLYAEPFTYLSLAVAVYFAVAYRQDNKWYQVFLMSLALCITILYKVVNLTIVPFFFWYVAVPNFNIFNFKAFNWQVIWIAIPAVLLPVIIFLGYNAYRFGNPLDAGYRFNKFFSTPLWVGPVGMLVNPYKSIFLYVPLFVLIPFTVKTVWQRCPRELILILGILTSYFIIFGGIFSDWGGGRTWGPRYLVPVNGLLTLLLLPLIDRVLQPRQWPARIILVVFAAVSIMVQILGISARDDVYLGAEHYWKLPPNFSIWGTFPWDQPDRWPIWGHLLQFDLARFNTAWHWQWQEINHFDVGSLLAIGVVVGMGLGGIYLWFYNQSKASKELVIAAWLVALLCVGVILWRSFDDPRSIKMASQVAHLWPAYSQLMKELPKIVSPQDTVVFTDRRFEFYLFDTDKTRAQRLLVSKQTQPDILNVVPHVILDRAQQGKTWLVTDELDNRELSYSVELWLNQRGVSLEHHLFGESVQLTAYQLQNNAGYSAIPPKPNLTVVIDPHNNKFKGIASLLGWNFPQLAPNQPPTLQIGHRYALELYWVYLGKSSEDMFFVRLIDDNGQVVHQVFTTPRPDSRFVIGQLITEDATIILPEGIQPGSYKLEIGFTIPVVEEGELLFNLPSELSQITVSEP